MESEPMLTREKNPLHRTNFPQRSILIPLTKGTPQVGLFALTLNIVELTLSAVNPASTPSEARKVTHASETRFCYQNNSTTEGRAVSKFKSEVIHRRPSWELELRLSLVSDGWRMGGGFFREVGRERWRGVGGGGGEATGKCDFSRKPPEG